MWYCPMKNNPVPYITDRKANETHYKACTHFKPPFINPFY
jgi:hypothetical protein